MTKRARSPSHSTTRGTARACSGSILNDFGGDQAPPGWDEFAAFVGNHQGGGYYDYSMFVEDAAGVRTERYGSSPQDYSTDVLADDAVRFIRATPSDTPLFLYAAPYAPHAGIVPAPGDIGTWSGYRQQLPPNFDETDVSDKPPYISQRQQLPERPMRTKFELEYEALQGVDRLVGRSSTSSVTDRLLGHDPGLHVRQRCGFGEHRWDYKLTPYEEAIHVPMVVRYDPLTARPSGTSLGRLVANVDVAPTIADVVGIAFDGVGRSTACRSRRAAGRRDRFDRTSCWNTSTTRVLPRALVLRAANRRAGPTFGTRRGSEELYRSRPIRTNCGTSPPTATDHSAGSGDHPRPCRPLPPEYRWA